MTDLAVHVHSLRQHQLDVLTALDDYPFEGRVLTPDLKLIPLRDGVEDAAKWAALVWMVTGGGKTRPILARAFQQLKRALDVGAWQPIILLVAHNETTVGRFDEEFQKVQASSKPMVTGSLVPRKIVTLTGKSSGIAFDTLRNGGVVAMSTGYLLNRIKDTKAGRITDRQWMDNVVEVNIDEGAHYAASTWSSVAKSFNNARVIYWSGTPLRHDKKLLPGVPYKFQEVKQGRATEYTLLDVSIITGVERALYTLAQANKDGAIKRISPAESKWFADAEDPETADGALKADNLEKLRAKAKKAGFIVRPFKNDEAVKELLRAALRCHREAVAAHPGAKLSVIGQGANTRDVDRLCRLSNEIGWNAVPYYSPREDDEDNDEPPIPSEEMEENLRQFEDQNSPVNLCWQVNCLTEGYDNDQVFMVILGCVMHSFARLQQLLGRTLRPNEAAKLLAAMFWTLNVQPNRGMFDDYCEQAVDLTFLVEDGDELPGGDPYPELDYAATAWVYGDGTVWQKIVANFDTAEHKLREEWGDFIKPEEWGAFKKAYSEKHGSKIIPNPVPDDPEEATNRYREILKEIFAYLKRNGHGTLMKYPKVRRFGVIGTVRGTVIGELYPGLKGGISSRTSSLESLAQFIADFEEDPARIKNACLARLKVWRA